MPANKSIKYVNIYTPAEKCIECFKIRKEGRMFVSYSRGKYFVCTKCLEKMKLLADGVK